MQILCIIEILSQTYKKQRPNVMFVYIFFYNFKISHSKGGFGSKGYGYDWKIEEAQKNILRTILEHFEKDDFFRFLAPLAPWENGIITVILPILANFTILKIAYTNSH